MFNIEGGVIVRGGGVNVLAEIREFMSGGGLCPTFGRQCCQLSPSPGPPKFLTGLHWSAGHRVSTALTALL